MKKISYLDMIQSSASFEEVQRRPRKPVRVILDNIRSLYNVGSIFRTSDAAGIDRLYLCGITGAPPRAEIHKAALGSEHVVPWEKEEDPVNVAHRLKKEGFQLIALEHTDSGVPYHEADFRFPLCLMVGHEITGVSDALVEMADMAIEIPMHGIKQSLNVAVAYGIAIYEIVKRIRAT